MTKKRCQGSPYKFLEDFEKKISGQVDEMIKAHSSPDFLFLSDRDKTFLKQLFMAGFKMGKEDDD